MGSWQLMEGHPRKGVVAQSTAVDTTTGGWQMDSPETDVGSGKDGLCRAPEAREGHNSKEMIPRS